jgi:hypothetical protein
LNEEGKPRRGKYPLPCEARKRERQACRRLGIDEIEPAPLWQLRSCRVADLVNCQAPPHFCQRLGRFLFVRNAIHFRSRGGLVQTAPATKREGGAWQLQSCESYRVAEKGAQRIVKIESRPKTRTPAIRSRRGGVGSYGRTDGWTATQRLGNATPSPCNRSKRTRKRLATGALRATPRTRQVNRVRRRGEQLRLRPQAGLDEARPDRRQRPPQGSAGTTLA